MPVPPEHLYREAADWRITWEEALQWTRVIDEDGQVRKPVSASEKASMEAKIKTLKRYSKISKDDFLKDVLKKL